MGSDEEARRGTFTCDSCGETYDKTWSDEEAAAEAEGLFPGIDISDRHEAGVVCTDCYEHILGRVRAEAPELIGPGWRGSDPEVLEDGSLLYDVVLPGQILDEAAELGITQDELDREMADMFSTPPGYVPGVGFVSGLAMRMLAESPLFRHPAGDSKCYRAPAGFMVHVKPGCRC